MALLPRDTAAVATTASHSLTFTFAPLSLGIPSFLHGLLPALSRLPTAVAAPAAAPAVAPLVMGAAPLLMGAGRVAAVMFLTYALWWLAFPAEGGSRNRWQPSVLPKRLPVRCHSHPLGSMVGILPMHPRTLYRPRWSGLTHKSKPCG